MAHDRTSSPIATTLNRDERLDQSHVQSPPAATNRLTATMIAAILVALSFIAFGQSTACQFLADDFVPLSYLWQAFHGQPQILWMKLLGPWQDPTVQLFYRPISEVSLILDYLLHGPNPFWFHLTNILLHAAAGVLVFLVGRRLLQIESKLQAIALALSAAMLFIVHPLNTETVTWVIGRVDSLCAVFYLLSFYLFLRTQSFSTGSLISFFCALASKETAATLPAVVFCYHLFVGAPASAWRSRLSSSMKAIAPYLACLIAFMMVRAICIGTFIGGYQGSIGEAYQALSWDYPIISGTLFKLFYPNNQDLIGNNTLVVDILHWAYVCAGAFVIVGTCLYKVKPNVRGLLLFLLSWTVLSVLPGWKLAIVHPTLAGGRFFYLALAPMCLLAGTVVCMFTVPAFTALRKEGTFTGNRMWMRIPATVILIVLTGCFLMLDRINSRSWLEASLQTQALKAALVATTRALPSGLKAVLINVPTNFSGAHACYRFDMIEALLSPPFTTENLSNRLEILQLHHDGALLNQGLLRRAVSKQYPTYVWDYRRKTLLPFEATGMFQTSATAGSERTPISLRVTESIHRGKDFVDRFVATFDPPLNPTEMGFVVATIGTKDGSRTKLQKAPYRLTWSNGSGIQFKEQRQLELPGILNVGTQQYCFSVGQRKAWLLSKSISELTIDIPVSRHRSTLFALEALPVSRRVPNLTASSAAAESVDGRLAVSGTGCWLNYDATAIVGASNVLVEVSKPNSYFEHYSGQLHDDKPSAFAGHTLHLKNAAGKLFIAKELLGNKAVHQVRIFAIGTNGKVVSRSSDPVELSTI